MWCIRSVLSRTCRSQRTIAALSWRGGVPCAVPIVTGTWIKIFSRGAANAVVLPLVLQSNRRPRIPAAASIPQRDIRLGSLALEGLDDFRRTVAPISNRFMDRNLILFANPLKLSQIRLVVVPAACRHFSIENDPTVGINCLMHFVFELPGR